jgi:hypothetical protein
VNPRTGLDDLEKGNVLTLLGLELQPLGRPGRSQSLYGLRHSGSQVILRLKHHRRYVISRVGNLKEEMSLCAQQEIRYEDYC